MASPHLLAVGGAHIDRRGRIAGDFAPGASNPGTMGEDVGGGGFNALRHAVRRGVSASILSVRGGDYAGDRVADAIEAAGIADLSAVFLDRATPSYTALLDSGGDVIAALADMALYEMAFPKQIRRAKLREALAASDAILCDANLPAAALHGLMALASGKPVFAIAISPAKAVRLGECLGGLSCLFMNRREAAALAGHDASVADVVGSLRDKGLARGVVTQGDGAAVGFDASGLFAVDPPVSADIVDVTGAGDALAGAATAALMRGSAFREAVREGLAAALLTIQAQVSAPDYSASDFADALALVPQARKMT